MSLLETIKRRFGAESDHMVYAFLGESEPLAPHASYFRVFLEEMYLARAVTWGQRAFPGVHAEVRLRFAGRDEITFSAVARPPEDALTSGVHLGYRVTDLLPYSGGTVELSAALLALPGPNELGPAVDVLTELGTLLGPPLGQVLPLARSLAAGTRRMLDPWADQVQLGMHRTFVAAGDPEGAALRPGCIAVIAADAAGFPAGDLRVVDQRLHLSAPDGASTSGLTGYDYMLLRIEGREERDDWRIQDIDEPLKRALIALDEGSVAAATAYRAIALAAARRSSDLAEADRARVIKAIKDEFALADERGHGATGDEPPDLGEVMRQRAVSRSVAARHAPRNDEELFA
jgi:hypothetical protein